MTFRSLQVVWACTNVNTPSRTAPHVLGWQSPPSCHELLPTVIHGCMRSPLNPISASSNRSIHAFLSQTFAAPVLRSTTSVETTCSASTRVDRPGFATFSRLLVSASSPLSFPMPRRLRHSRYFAVCRALVNPSAAFVWVGSLTTTHFLSSCFPWSHRSLVSMC